MCKFNMFITAVCILFLIIIIIITIIIIIIIIIIISIIIIIIIIRNVLSGTLVNTAKLKELTCVKEKDSIGIVQSIKMLPLTVTSKVLPETLEITGCKRPRKSAVISKQKRGKYEQIFHLLCVRGH